MYVVQHGDSMWKIAKRYGLSVDTLIAANPQVANPNVLNVGDRLNLPLEDMSGGMPVYTPPGMPLGAPANMAVPGGYGQPTWQYVVKAGDSMWKISQQVGVPLQMLAMANPQISDPTRIAPGQVIHIPGSSPSVAMPMNTPMNTPMNMPMNSPGGKQYMTSPKANTAAKEYNAPMAQPAMPTPVVPPVAPQFHIDANVNYTNIKEETKVTKLKPTPPSVAKVYVKEEIIKERPIEPIGEQVICWDPCNPPPEGPIVEGPFVPYGPSAHPFAPVLPYATSGYTKSMKMRESSSMWVRDSSWLRDSST